MTSGMREKDVGLYVILWTYVPNAETTQAESESDD